MSDSSYKAGDLSRMLFPSAPAPPVVNGKPDPTFFGYLKPQTGRLRENKASKGAGKFSKANLHRKNKEKKENQKQAREKHETEVKEAAARKEAAREARIAANKERKAAKAAAGEEASSSDDEDNVDEDEEEEEDHGVDEDNSEIDDLDEDDLEDFMADIEKEDAALPGDENSSEEEAEESPEGKADRLKAERVAKREKRLAEDEAMETPRQKKKDVKKARRENIEKDPRNSRTIFIGNVPTKLKSAKLAKWVESELGIDSAVQQSIVESVRYRSVAVADPKLPRRVAIQKGLLHEDRDSLNAYLVFTETQPTTEPNTWVERAVKQLNGKEFEMDDKTWRFRVDRVGSGSRDAENGGEGEASAASSSSRKPHHDNANTVFCGNLPFNVNENELYSHFDICGPLDYIRIVRDRESQMGKGIAFLSFKDAQSMRNALAFNGTKFGTRTLRVMKSVENKKLHHTNVGGAKDSKDSASKKKDGNNNNKGSSSSSSGGAAATKEGYGGKGKFKELNQAGVLKKPRHVPRTGGPNQSAAANKNGAAASSSSSSSSNKKPHQKEAGKKRSFEGDRADPEAHIKKQKVEDFKHREKKEKRKDAKKL